MGLTRPRLGQLQTTTSAFDDPIVVLNNGATGTNAKDIGIVFERGDDQNQVLLWDESADQFVLASSTEQGSTSGDVTLASYAGLQIGALKASSFVLNGALTFPTADGTANQYLKTNGSGTLSWGTVTSSLTLAADSGTPDTFNTGETLTFAGGTGIDTTVSNNQISIAIDSTVATLTGSQTLTNKTLTSPTVNTPTITTPTITGNATFDTNTLFVDATNNRVGIGTTSPAYQVEIENTGANALLVLDRTDGAACFIEGQATRSAFGSVGATPLALAYNSLAVVTIGAGGAITVNPDGGSPFTFPTADGSANQFLQTNGSGTVSFASATVSDISDLTATAAELNILDGVTATTAELNILDGVTATAAELNYTDGVTSNIQTQLNAKASLSGATFTGDIKIQSGTNEITKYASAAGVGYTLIRAASDNADVTLMRIGSLSGTTTEASDSGQYGFSLKYMGTRSGNDNTFSIYADNQTGSVVEAFAIKQDGTLYQGGTTNTIWHAGNDGSGSGLDADTVDGVQASSFLRSDATDSASGALTFSGGLTMTSALTLNAQNDLRFADSDSSNYVGFQAPATVASNILWTLPNTDGTDGQVLSTDGGGTLSWQDAGGAASGSSYPNSTFTTAPGSEGDFDLSYNVAQTVQETPFEATGTDPFGVNLGSVFSLMDPVGSIETVDMGALT